MRGSKHEVACSLLLSDQHVCSIMQEDTSTVNLLNLPCDWHIQDTIANTLILPCQHVFHPTAIAQHFTYQHMRCPVCRVGSDETMLLEKSEVPDSVKDALKTNVARMNTEDRDEEDRDTIIEYDPGIDVDSVRNMLSIHVEINLGSSHTVMILSSRLLPTIHANEATFFEVFNVHRSFQRQLFSNARRFVEVDGATVRLSMRHPVILHPICSVPVSVRQFVSASSVLDMKAQTTGNETLAQGHVQSEDNGMTVAVNITAIKLLCVHSIAAYINEFPFSSLF